MVRHIVFGIALMVVVSSLLVGVWYLTRLPAVTISQIRIEGGETIPHDQVRSVIETVLGNSYLLLVPHRFAYTYPHDAVVHAVEGIPRVRSVYVERPDPKSLNVAFDEFTPFALWCLDTPNAPCYFLDDTGYAFAPAPALDGGALVRHTHEGDTELSVGHAFSGDDFAYIHAFTDRLRDELGLRITDVRYSKEGDIELFINGGGSLKITREQNQDDTFAYLASILASKEFKHLKPGNFNYIDLRFGKKIFVNEELVPSEGAATTSALEDI